MTTENKATRLQVNLQAGIIQNQKGVFHQLAVVTWFSCTENDENNGNDILYVFGDPTHTDARKRCPGEIPSTYGKYTFFFAKELDKLFHENQCEQRPILFVCTKNVRTKEISMRVSTAELNEETGEITWKELSHNGEIPAIRCARACQISLLNTFFERTAWAAERDESPYKFKPLARPVDEKKEAAVEKRKEAAYEARIRRATPKERKPAQPVSIKVDEPTPVEALEIDELPSRKVMKHINGVLSCMGIRLVYVAETGCFCVQMLHTAKEATKSQKAFAQHCIQSSKPGSPSRYGATEYAEWLS